MAACHMCGIPDGGTDRGRVVEVIGKAQFGDKRARKSTVWVCSNECAHQALAVSKYGPASSKWPVTLAQFRKLNRLEVR